MGWRLSAPGDPVRRGFIKRFDPRFWTVNFPRPMMAAVTTTRPLRTRPPRRYAPLHNVQRCATSYNSSGSPSGSAKKVKRLPVISSTRTGSTATRFDVRKATASSRSATANARCRNPQASGYEGLDGARAAGRGGTERCALARAHRRIIRGGIGRLALGGVWAGERQRRRHRLHAPHPRQRLAERLDAALLPRLLYAQCA